MTTKNDLAEECTAGGWLNDGAMLRAILFGTLIAGVMDITAACLTWWFRDVPALRVFQSVAGGLLGRATYQGGTSTATLGLLLHFAIMAVIVAVYVAASTRLAVLTDQAVACGIAYGIAVYLVMTFIVVPVSAAAGGALAPYDLLIGVIVHILCVGVPIALVARRFASVAS